MKMFVNFKPTWKSLFFCLTLFFSKRGGGGSQHFGGGGYESNIWIDHWPGDSSRDLLIPKRWRSLRLSHWKGRVNSPSKKGHLVGITTKMELESVINLLGCEQRWCRCRVIQNGLPVGLDPQIFAVKKWIFLLGLLGTTQESGHKWRVRIPDPENVIFLVVTIASWVGGVNQRYFQIIYMLQYPRHSMYGVVP